MTKDEKKKLDKRIGEKPGEAPRRLTKWDRHEALDRCHVVAELFDGYVLDTAFVQSKAVLKVRAEKVSAALHDLYQAIGREKPRKKGQKKT